MSAHGFQRVNVGGGLQRWTRPGSPVFVSYWPRVGSMPGEFAVYEAVAAVPSGREPWTVNNRRVAAPVRSLRAALKVAQEQLP